MIKDCAKIADNTVIPPNTVIPALSSFSGSPGEWPHPSILKHERLTCNIC